MKTQTIVNDIKSAIECKNWQRELDSAQGELAEKISQLRIPEEIVEALQTAVAMLRNAKERFAKVPRDRRENAEHIVKTAEIIGKSASRLGGFYSGETEFRVLWEDGEARAGTSTSLGESYPGKKSYRKTNAAHCVRLSHAGAIELVSQEQIRDASLRDGLPLISLMPDGRSVWVRKCGQKILSEAGWIAHKDGVCYHSVKSVEDAQRGLRKKLNAIERQQKLTRNAAKISRRAKLIARLCNGVVATLKDAKALGFCSPGIAQFQATHGIGDSATLPELMRTGNPSAQLLALTIARKVASKKELEGGLE